LILKSASYPHHENQIVLSVFTLVYTSIDVCLDLCCTDNCLIGAKAVVVILADLLKVDFNNKIDNSRVVRKKL